MSTLDSMRSCDFLLALEVKEGLAAGNIAQERDALKQMQKEVSQLGGKSRL